MKHLNDPIDKELFRLMQESRHKAAADFTDRIMQNLPENQAIRQPVVFGQGLPQYIFKPLLSWRALLGSLAIIGAISWLFSQLMAPSTNSSYVNSLLQQYSPIPSVDLSLHSSWLVLTLLLAVFLLVGADRLLKRLFN